MMRGLAGRGVVSPMAFALVVALVAGSCASGNDPPLSGISQGSVVVDDQAAGSTQPTGSAPTVGGTTVAVPSTTAVDPVEVGDPTVDAREPCPIGAASVSTIFGTTMLFNEDAARLPLCAFDEPPMGSQGQGLTIGPAFGPIDEGRADFEGTGYGYDVNDLSNNPGSILEDLDGGGFIVILDPDRYTGYGYFQDESGDTWQIMVIWVSSVEPPPRPLRDALRDLTILVRDTVS